MEGKGKTGAMGDGPQGWLSRAQHGVHREPVDELVYLTMDDEGIFLFAKSKTKVDKIRPVVMKENELAAPILDEPLTWTALPKKKMALPSFQNEQLQAICISGEEIKRFAMIYAPRVNTSYADGHLLTLRLRKRISGLSWTG